MLEAHAPHEPVHTWKSFFIHIATIVVGLLIAVGLEQAVEAIHHREQRAQLEEQMRQAFANDVQFIQTNVANLGAFRGYLTDLLAALAARRGAKAAPAAPSSDDPRATISMVIPGIAPYEAAKQNGTVALLSSQRIRLYNRVSLQHGFVMSALDQFQQAEAALNAFSRRFEYASGTHDMAHRRVYVADLGTLSPAELVEYQAAVARLLEATDYVIVRMQNLARQSRLVLDGADDENEIITGAQSGASEAADR